MRWGPPSRKLKVDKDSMWLKTDKSNYFTKFHKMIEEGIIYQVFASTNDSTLKDLRLFQGSLYRNFENWKKSA